MQVSLKEIKEAKDRGHGIGSFILVLEKKERHFLEGSHWFIIDDKGRNVCEFCGTLYAFGESGTPCDRTQCSAGDQIIQAHAREAMLARALNQ